MRKVPLFLGLLCFCCGVVRGQVTASFTVPGAVCVGSQVSVTNTTVGGTNYFWSFCAADFSTTPQATNIGNPSNSLNEPVFGCYAQDNSGNFYGLVTDYALGHVTRLSFGNSLLNAPTGVDLGDFGGIIPEQVEGIQLLEVNGNWTAVIVGGGNQFTNSAPRVVKLDFGTALSNTPIATNWGNVGGLNLPHKLIVFPENGSYYGLTENVNDNTLTRLSFGPDFTAAPTGVNLGNIGGLDYPCGLTYVKSGGNLYVYIVNRDINSITCLNFGNSVLNTPTGIVLGDPGYLNYPRDIALFSTCSGIYGFVSNETSNELVQLDFGNNPVVLPTATDLGNIGNLSFPHSISDFFRVGNDIYSFIHNVTTSSLTMLRFAGCSSIPGSGLQNPAAVTYDTPGVYTINLLVDVGLPTQTSYCQQITVNPLPAGRLVGDTVCYGNTPAVLFTAEVGTAPYSIGYTDGQNNYSQNNLNGQSAIAPPYTLTNPGSETFELQTITDANGCSATIDSSTTVLVRPIPQGGISGSSSCTGDSVRLLFQGTGSDPFGILVEEGGNVYQNVSIWSGQYIDLPPLSAAGATATYMLEALTDTFQCSRVSGFTSPMATITVYPTPQLAFDSLQPVCVNKAPFQITAGSETSGLAGKGVYSGAGINAAGEFSPLWAGPGEHLLMYTYSTATCSDSISGSILVDPLPIPQPAALNAACGEMPVQVQASGGTTYSWSPAAGLSDPGIANPVVQVDTTTTYIATVTSSGGCVAYDTVTVDVIIGGKNFFRVPNAFTPNGDGHNDCWGVQYWPGVTIEELDVFNRWGTRVFTTINPSDCWNGTMIGEMQPAGAYAYVIRARTPCGEVKRTGTVMLIR
jgi:gliding motility-associated-like protein